MAVPGLEAEVRRKFHRLTNPLLPSNLCAPNSESIAKQWRMGSIRTVLLTKARPASIETSKTWLNRIPNTSWDSSNKYSSKSSHHISSILLSNHKNKMNRHWMLRPISTDQLWLIMRPQLWPCLKPSNRRKATMLTQTLLLNTGIRWTSLRSTVVPSSRSSSCNNNNVITLLNKFRFKSRWKSSRISLFNSSSEVEAQGCS